MLTPAFSPLYSQIKDLILQSLQSAEWKPGEMIPSEIVLAKRYQVSQGTVRKALDALTKDNHLTRRQGRGTFVATHAEQQVQFRFLKLVADPAESTSQSDLKVGTQRRVLVCKKQRTPSGIAKALSLKSSDQVFYIQRVLSLGNSSAESTPTILEDIWLPASAFKGLSLQTLQNSNAPMYAMFEAVFGVHMVRAVEHIRAVLPNPTQVDLLKLGANTPLLSVERTAFSYQDFPMEFRQGLYLTQNHHYRNELG